MKALVVQDKIFSDEKQLQQFAEKLAVAALPQVGQQPLLIFLYGPLGAGKTTFARGFLRGLGYQGKVKSPTYTLVEPYELETVTVFHFDLYRVAKSEELHHLGLEDYFRAGVISLIEWPEKGFPLLPSADLACYIDFIDDSRTMTIEAYSARGQALLAHL